jgi:hypothetical protein
MMLMGLHWFFVPLRSNRKAAEIGSEAGNFFTLVEAFPKTENKLGFGGRFGISWPDCKTGEQPSARHLKQKRPPP